MRENCLNQSKEEECIDKRTENKNNTKETSPMIPIIIMTIKGLNLPFKNKDYGGKKQRLWDHNEKQKQNHSSYTLWDISLTHKDMQILNKNT